MQNLDWISLSMVFHMKRQGFHIWAELLLNHYPENEWFSPNAFAEDLFPVKT
jgi:hypothetical protein